MDARTLCLAVLSLGDASPYEIKSKVEDIFARFMDVAPSSIYAAVKSLEQDGLIAGTFTAQDKRPNKTIYRLLEPGRRALSGALEELEGRHRIRSELVALLIFAHLVPPEKLRGVLESRVAELSALEDEMNRHPEPLEPGQRFALDLGRIMVDAERNFIAERGPALLHALEADNGVPLAQQA